MHKITINWMFDYRIVGGDMLELSPCIRRVKTSTIQTDSWPRPRTRRREYCGGGTIFRALLITDQSWRNTGDGDGNQ